MNTSQQQDIQRIIQAYRESDDMQRPQWREVASYVYANALRDQAISPIELRTAFRPLEHIASSAGLMENAEAVGAALAQPVKEAITTARTGQAWTATAMHLLKMQQEPLYPLQQLRDGFRAMTSSVDQWAEHMTGGLSMEERQRLAHVYELPHEQRLRALHGITLHDTSTMVGIGTLPGLLPRTGIAADAAMPGSLGGMFQDAQLPMPLSPRQGELVLAGTSTNIGDLRLPNLMAMNKPPSRDASSTGESGNEISAAQQQAGGNGDIPEEIMRYREIYMLDNTHAAFSQHLASIRVLDGKKKIELYAHENKLIDNYTNYLINPRIVQTTDEYRQLMENTRSLVSEVGQAELHRALAESVDPEEALARSREPERLFEQMVPWLEARRQRQIADVLTEDAEYARMQTVLQHPDAVGYGRSVAPRSITERELHHADYWERLWQDANELAQHLQLLGLQSQADTVVDEIKAMVHIELDDSKKSHAKLMENFMAIAQDADKVDVNALSGQGYTARGFEKIRDNIGGELHHLRDEIGQEQEYFIRSQLWRLRHAEENRVKDDVRYTAIRDELFGNTSLEDAPDHER